MAPKQGKRQAPEATTAAQVEEHASKRIRDRLRELGVNRSNYEAVVDIIRHPLAGDVPAECRGMLASSLVESLCVAQDLRHDFQHRTVAMVGELAEAVLACLGERFAEASRRQLEVEASEAERRSALASAEEGLSALKSAEELCFAALAAASQQSAAARAALAQAEGRLGAVEAGTAALAAQLADLQAFASGPFAKLRDGLWEEPEEATGLADELGGVLGRLALEESLASAAPGALLRRPAERGGFAQVVVGSLGEAFARRAAELQKDQSELQAERALHLVEVEAARKEVEDRLEGERLAAETFVFAQSGSVEATALRGAALEALEAFGPEAAAAAARAAERRQELEEFQDYNLACFAVLRDRLSEEHRRERPAAARAARAAEEQLSDLKAQADQGPPAAEVAVAGA